MLTRRRLLWCGSVGLASLAAASALSACGSGSADELSVREAVSTALEPYTADGVADRADQLLDERTRAELSEYGIDAGTFVERCLENLSYEVGDVTVDGDAATVSVIVTNADIDAAMSTAASRFEAYADTDDAEETFEDGGEAALMAKLFDYLYEGIESSADLVSETVEVTCSKDEAGVWACSVADNPTLEAALFGRFSSS